MLDEGHVQGHGSGDESFYLRLFKPIREYSKPFGENVEGLSHFRNKIYADEGQVQTDGFQNTSLRGVIGVKPAVTQTLRKFKHLLGEFSVLIAPPTACAERMRTASA